MRRVDISIHTPAKGVTFGSSAMSTMPNYFNPHSRKGSDTAVELKAMKIEFISIHTPAKGVTDRP